MRTFTSSAVGGAAEEEPRAQGRKGRRSAKNRSRGAAARHRQVLYRSCPASMCRPASSNPAYVRSTRDSFMVFREAKSLARTLAPLVKKSEALGWMKPVWARQALDAFLFECYKVLSPPVTYSVRHRPCPTPPASRPPVRLPSPTPSPFTRGPRARQRRCSCSSSCTASLTQHAPEGAGAA